MRAKRDLRRQAEAADVAGGAHGGRGDLFGGRVVVHLRVGDEDRLVLQDHHRQRPDRVQPVAPQHLPDEVQVPRELPDRAADEAVGLVPVNHDRADRGGVRPHDRPRDVGGDAAPGHQPVIGFPVVAVARVAFGVHDLEVGFRPDRQGRAFAAGRDHVGAADQDRHLGRFFQHGVGGAQDPLVLAIGKDDAPGGGRRCLEHRAHDEGRAEDRAVQIALVGVEVGHGPRGHARLHRGAGDGGGDDADQARVEGLGDQVVRAEAQPLAAVGCGGLGAGGGAGQRRDALDAGDLHLVVDARRAHVQRAAEDEGEAQDVVDLVGIVAAAGGDDRVRAGGAHVLGHDLGPGVGEGEDNRRRRHPRDHAGRQHAGAGQAKEQVRAVDHVVQRPQVGRLRERRLFWVHVDLAARVDKAVDVAQPHVLAPDAQLQQHVEAGDPRRAAAGRDDLDVLKPLARDQKRVGRGRAHHDGGAVLVVVEDGDVHRLAAQFFHDEAVGRLDVFQVDRAEGRLERADDGGEPLGVGFVHLDVEAVDVGELLEQDRLALHHRFRGEGAYVAQSQHRRPVADHGDEVPARGIAGGGRGIGLDLKTGLGHAGGIGAAQVAAVRERLRCPDFQLSRARKFVVIQRRLPCRVLPPFVHSCPRLCFGRRLDPFAGTSNPVARSPVPVARRFPCLKGAFPP